MTTRSHATRRLLAGLATLAALAACAPPEPLLPGPRFDLRGLGAASEAMDAMTPEQQAAMRNSQVPQPPKRVPNAPYTVTGEARRLSLPAPRVNANWTHPGGSNTHQISHPALGAAPLTRVWSASIGQGNTRRLRLSASPVVVAGRVVTLDTVSDLRAHSTDGALLWTRNLTPTGETAGEATGGGIAAAGQRLFVTTGYGALHAIDLGSGALLWTQRLGAVPGSAPTVDRDIVYVTSRDGQGWALDVASGRILWQIAAGEPGPVIDTGPSPVVTSRAVVFPFGSGELVAALKRGGVRLWSTTVSGQRRGRGYTGVSDIGGGPVVVGNTIYAANPAGRLAALDAASGERIWTAREGASSPVWPVGGALFLISDENQLLRLNAADGTTVWSASLPLFTDERVRRRFAVYAHYGPLLAGGRLIVASSDAMLRQVDPVSGNLISATELSAGAAVNPVVAGGTLYIVTTDGQLHAFR